MKYITQILSIWLILQLLIVGWGISSTRNMNFDGKYEKCEKYNVALSILIPIRWFIPSEYQGKCKN